MAAKFNVVFDKYKIITKLVRLWFSKEWIKLMIYSTFSVTASSQLSGNGHYIQNTSSNQIKYNSLHSGYAGTKLFCIGEI